ncbi:MAG TPA: energy transducer TonB [Smithella sp.]|nr:energy transducer TonB [Smithella sp.]
MKFTRPENKKYTIVSAACFSVMIHTAVGALLIFDLSNNSITPPKLNGLNLVWVSLDAQRDTQSKKSGVEIDNSRAEQPSPATGKMAEKKTDVEKTAGPPEGLQIYAAAAKEPVSNITPAKYGTQGTGTATQTKEQPCNLTGNGADQSTGKPSNAGTEIAYPLYKENARPVYPEIARVRGYEGIVLVFAEILPDGRVGEIKIRKSSGYAILDQSAIQAVKPWKFEPAKKSGNPFTVWVELPIKFILHNNSSQS